jgi:hypothetical protein
MKTPLLLFIICLGSFSAMAQGYGKPMGFSSIEKVDSTTRKETLYWNGLEWLGKHFNNANKVIQISDKEAGIILAKGSFAYNTPGSLLNGVENRTISFMLKFSFKDGKYKLELSDFNDEQLGQVTVGDYEDHSLSKKNVAKQWKAAQDEVQRNIHNIYTSIKDFMWQTQDW